MVFAGVATTDIDGGDTADADRILILSPDIRMNALRKHFPDGLQHLGSDISFVFSQRFVVGAELIRRQVDDAQAIDLAASHAAVDGNTRPAEDKRRIEIAVVFWSGL